jgi:hypothetical protein
MTVPSRPIQIKRSVENATLPTLAGGELAFTQAGNNFFIGSPDEISGNIRIGHKLHDGVLTANEALVANSTGGIDRVYTSNLEVKTINANGALGNVSYILSSGGLNGNVYWAPIQGPYYITTQMYDFTDLGLGWMNLAPNVNTTTYEVMVDFEIQHGAIWISARNPGTIDTTPITVYSPHTQTGPMMWISYDKSGPYHPTLNPNGKDYWLKITPPPAYTGA